MKFTLEKAYKLVLALAFEQNRVSSVLINVRYLKGNRLRSSSKLAFLREAAFQYSFERN